VLSLKMEIKFSILSGDQCFEALSWPSWKATTFFGFLVLLNNLEVFKG
jgi:hypothetical protein